MGQARKILYENSAYHLLWDIRRVYAILLITASSEIARQSGRTVVEPDDVRRAFLDIVAPVLQSGKIFPHDIEVRQFFTNA